MKIISARITDYPKGLFDPMPMVYVTMENNKEEFLGLTIDEAKNLKFIKDKDFLQS